MAQRARAPQPLHGRPVGLLLDGAGQVSGLHTLTDSVTLAQRRALAARDGGCSARGCSPLPAFCDAHHLTARADDGPTELEKHNLEQ